jgi:hypothetical protein
MMALMAMLRRRLASYALVLLVCHSALVFAAPLSSCCPSRHHASAIAPDNAEPDCCPAGSHAPGQCPRHARGAATTKVTCRMQCDAPHGVQFLLGAAGLLPPPAASFAEPIASRAIGSSAVDPETRPFVPDLPPPRA